MQKLVYRKRRGAGTAGGFGIQGPRLNESFQKIRKAI
jgi:hypothetical protein